MSTPTGGETCCWATRTIPSDEPPGCRGGKGDPKDAEGIGRQMSAHFDVENWGCVKALGYLLVGLAILGTLALAGFYFFSVARLIPNMLFGETLMPNIVIVLLIVLVIWGFSRSHKKEQ